MMYPVECSIRLYGVTNATSGIDCVSCGTTETSPDIPTDICKALCPTILQRGIIRIYHDYVQGQGNPPKCQRFVVHDEACRDIWHEGWFPCPCTKSWLIILLLPLSIPITKSHFCYEKLLQARHFLVRKRQKLELIMTSCHRMIYDVTRCSLNRSCLSRGR